MCVSILFFVLASVATAQSVRTISLRGGAKMQIALPMGYSFETVNNPDGSVGFKMENPVWGIFIAGLVANETSPELMKPEWQQNKLITFIGQALSISQEKDYIFKPLNPDSGNGVFCSFTAEGADDGHVPAPGSATRLTGGLRAWPGRVVIFRIVSNSLKSEEYREAFEIFRTGLTMTKK